jgi:hypothetical protein
VPLDPLGEWLSAVDAEQPYFSTGGAPLESEISPVMTGLLRPRSASCGAAGENGRIEAYGHEPHTTLTCGNRLCGPWRTQQGAWGKGSDPDQTGLAARDHLGHRAATARPSLVP